jgi:hypothetical protein
MKTSLRLLKVCVAVAVLATVTEALAQGGGGGGRNRGGRFLTELQIVQIEPVQKELAISDDQKASIGKLAEESRPNAGGGGGGNRPTPEEMQQRRDDQNKKVAEILLPNQQERLDQIMLQLQGADALSDPKVAEKLQLTDDEKTKLTDLSTEYQQKRRDLFQQGGGGGGGGAANQDAIQKLRTEQNDKAMAILTADQKDQFTKMEGTKLDIDPSLLRPNFGGGNGGGRRNRGNGGNGGGNGGNGGKGQPDA